MGLTLQDLTGIQRGMEAAETGLNSESFSCRYFPQFKDKLNNYQGQARGFALPDKYSREVRLSGEVAGSTGVMAAKTATAITFANDVGTFEAVSAGGNAGGFFLDEVTETQDRDGWRRVEMSFSSDPLIGVA